MVLREFCKEKDGLPVYDAGCRPWTEGLPASSMASRKTVCMRHERNVVQDNLVSQTGSNVWSLASGSLF